MKKITIRWPHPVRHYKKESKSNIRARLSELFDIAQEKSKDSLDIASRYVKRAKQISLANRISIPTALKRRMCKECGTYLISGKNATIRTQRGKVVIRCKECNNIFRIPYVAERKLKRKVIRKVYRLFLLLRLVGFLEAFFFAGFFFTIFFLELFFFTDVFFFSDFLTADFGASIFGSPFEKTLGTVTLLICSRLSRSA